MSNETKPSVGIRPWGTTPKKTRQFDDDLPRLPYIRLQPGINNVRIVTGIGTYYQVRWKGPKSKRAYGDRVRTSYPTYEDCPVKKFLGLTGKERYMVVAIHRVDQKDRSKDELGLLDLGPLAAEQIETNLEVKNSMRPDGEKVTPRDFDVSIKFDPKAKKATGFYSVVAHDTLPLSEADINLIEDVGGDEVLEKVLARQLICPKPETVIKRLKEDLGWDGTSLVKEEEKDSDLEEATEDDYSFKRPAGSEDSEDSSEAEAANG